MPFLVQGLFNTNAVSKSLPTGTSFITSPRYQLVSYTTLQTHTLNGSQPAGVAGLPVFSTGFTYQSKIYQYVSGSTFDEYTLSTNSVWLKDGVTDSVLTYLAESFFLQRPTNVTWSITRTIW